MKKSGKLEFYAFEHDFNNQELIRTNVLAHLTKSELLKNIKNRKIASKQEFIDYIKRDLMYHFWCKSEHEVLVSDLFCKPERGDKTFKIDVWYQLEPNLNIIVDLILDYYDIHFATVKLK